MPSLQLRAATFRVGAGDAFVRARKMTGTPMKQSPGTLQSVLVLMSWTAVAQVVSVIAMLALPRIFSPAHFGGFSIYSGFVVLFSIVAAGRYEFAIGLPRAETDGQALLWACVLLSALAAVAFCLVFVLMPADSPLIGRFPQLLSLWPAVAAGMACMAWYSAASYMALRHGQFRAVGVSKVAIALVTAGGQIAAGLLIGRSSMSLIIPFVIGQLAGAMVLLAAIGRRRIGRPEKTRVLAMLRSYSHFPRAVAPGSIMDGVSNLLPVTAAAIVLSVADAGIYALADRVLRMPVTLVGSSVLQVFYKQIADRRGDPAAGHALLASTWRTLALLAALPCLVIMVFGQELFAFAFGAEWRSSGAIAQLLVVWVFFQFVSYPTSNVLVVYEKTRSFLVWQAAQLACIAAALCLARYWHPGSLRTMVASLVVAQSLVCVLSMILQWRAVTSGSYPGEAAR